MNVPQKENHMKKFAALAAALMAAPSLIFAAPAFADSPGQLASGPTMYQVKNVTKGGAYGSTASATCGDVVKYSFQVANSEFGLLKDVTLKANLATGNATASAVNSIGETTSVSAHVTVNVDKGNLVYVPGSTQNFNVNGGLIKTLPDGVTAGGVNKGNLNGSTREFIQFQAKVECEVEVPKDITVCELATKKIITIKENQFDASKHSKNLNDCKEVVPGKIQVCELATKKVVTINENDFDAAKHSKDLNDCAEVLGEETPTVIASTGPASAIATMFGLSSLAAGIGYAVQRRRNILG
jgi:hypothetical protein